jgi:hypothetical protein
VITEHPLPDLKPGDIIIVPNRSGIHEVTKIERQFVTQNMIDSLWMHKDAKVGDEYSAPIIHFRRKLNSTGYRGSDNKCFCVAKFATKVTQEMIDQQCSKTIGNAQRLKEATEELIRIANGE